MTAALRFTLVLIAALAGACRLLAQGPPDVLCRGLQLDLRIVAYGTALAAATVGYAIAEAVVCAAGTRTALSKVRQWHSIALSSSWAAMAVLAAWGTWVQADWSTRVGASSGLAAWSAICAAIAGGLLHTAHHLRSLEHYCAAVHRGFGAEPRYHFRRSFLGTFALATIFAASTALSAEAMQAGLAPCPICLSRIVNPESACDQLVQTLSAPRPRNSMAVPRLLPTAPDLNVPVGPAPDAHERALWSSFLSEMRKDPSTIESFLHGYVEIPSNASAKCLANLRRRLLAGQALTLKRPSAVEVTVWNANVRGLAPPNDALSNLRDFLTIIDLFSRNGGADILVAARDLETGRLPDKHVAPDVSRIAREWEKSVLEFESPPKPAVRLAQTLRSFASALPRNPEGNFTVHANPVDESVPATVVLAPVAAARAGYAAPPSNFVPFYDVGSHNGDTFVREAPAIKLQHENLAKAANHYIFSNFSVFDVSIGVDGAPATAALAPGLLKRVGTLPVLLTADAEDCQGPPGLAEDVMLLVQCKDFRGPDGFCAPPSSQTVQPEASAPASQPAQAAAPPEIAIFPDVEAGWAVRAWWNKHYCGALPVECSQPLILANLSYFHSWWKSVPRPTQLPQIGVAFDYSRVRSGAGAWPETLTEITGGRPPLSISDVLTSCSRLSGRRSALNHVSSGRLALRDAGCDLREGHYEPADNEPNDPELRIPSKCIRQWRPAVAASTLQISFVHRSDDGLTCLQLADRIGLVGNYLDEAAHSSSPPKLSLCTAHYWIGAIVPADSAAKKVPRRK